MVGNGPLKQQFNGSKQFFPQFYYSGRNMEMATPTGEPSFLSLMVVAE
jgi:hypothetical protein